jgi:hypothetical protein
MALTSGVASDLLAKSKQARLVRWCWQIILNSQLSLLNSWQEDAYQAGCSLQKN